MKVFRPVHVPTSLVVLVAATVFSATAATASQSSASAATKPCAFQLRIGDVLPFTGDLATYGANLDRAVKLAVGAAERRAQEGGLPGRPVQLVGSEDGQTQACASVEAATKLIKANKANVIIGEMASGATIPMAQSVTIPNKVVLISPTSSAPQISDMKDNGSSSGRIRPTRSRARCSRRPRRRVRQGRDAQRRRAKRRVRNRTAGAFRRRVEEARREDRRRASRGILTQANFDTEARSSSDGNPAGWVIIDFPETFEKFAPSLVRSGKWERVEDVDDRGDPQRRGARQDRRSGEGAARHGGERGGRPGRQGVRGPLEEVREGREAVHGLRGHVVRRGDGRLPRGGAGCSSSPAKIKANLRAVSGPPGREGDLPERSRRA